MDVGYRCDEGLFGGNLVLTANDLLVPNKRKPSIFCCFGRQPFRAYISSKSSSRV